MIKLTFFLLMLFCLTSTKTIAHPHSFIDMRIAIDTQQDNYSGITYIWKMDPMTSADIAYELKGIKNDDPRWKKQEAIIMANILVQNYFTDFYYQNKKVKFKTIPNSYRLQKDGFQLVFTFSTSLAQPLPIANSLVEILTYDPTFYVSMTYQNKQQIDVPLEIAAHCNVILKEAEITDAMRSYAFSLDTDQSPDEDLALGKQFAQRINIQCP